MKSKGLLLGPIIAAALAFSCASWAGQSSQEKPAAKLKKPLIRTDLLQKKVIRTVAARRDLFSPRVIAGGEGLPSEVPKSKTALPGGEAPSGESQASSLILHYIGYSYNVTKQKFVALIFFEQQVTAVQEGDMLSMGWKITKITARELEVEGPDKKIQTFSREGEQR